MSFLFRCRFKSEALCIFILDTRINRVRKTIADILSIIKLHRRVTVRQIASLVSQLISMRIVVGDVVLIMTKSLSADIASAFSWDHLLNSLRLRRANSKSVSGETICALLIEEISLRLYNTADCDASCEGYAGYEVSTFNGVSHGAWSIEERIKPSVWRELMGVYRVLTSLIHILSGQNMKWFTDKQADTSTLHKGSMKSDLQVIAIDIFKLCLSHSIQ